MAAIDCLNVAANEGLSASTTDFKLCFAGEPLFFAIKLIPYESTASGDIRNLVRTVNSLPDDYSGKCDILFNDRDPIVVNRNFIFLYTLLNPIAPIPGAAELVLHLMYSAALSPQAYSQLCICASMVLGSSLDDEKPLADEHFSVRGRGGLHVVFEQDVLKEFLKMPLSNYRLEDAIKNMRSAMFHPSRVDYRDRHLAGLKPAHRVAWNHHRQTGVLAPFSAKTSHLTEPNR